jgi:hypothetical protein
MPRHDTAEDRRLNATWNGDAPWLRWGPYLSERQWGTVREDYSPHGNAWDYFPHDHARSRAYRWGEGGLAGVSDDKQVLCFALALWNGNDAILKERLFGLTNDQGNYGEDVKEYYFYQDSTPPTARCATSTSTRSAPIPMTTCSGRTAGAKRPIQVPWSTNCSTPGCSTRSGISTWRWNTPSAALRTS